MPLSLSSLSSGSWLSQFVGGRNTEHNTHGVKVYTHTHKYPETSYSVCSLLLPPQQQYETEEYPEMRNQSVSSSLTQESKFDLISQFHVPSEVVREKPKQSPYEPRNNQNHSHFLGQKDGFKELFCSTSEFYPSFTMLLDQKRGGKL